MVLWKIQRWLSAVLLMTGWAALAAMVLWCAVDVGQKQAPVPAYSRQLALIAVCAGYSWGLYVLTMVYPWVGWFRDASSVWVRFQIGFKTLLRALGVICLALVVAALVAVVLYEISREALPTAVGRASLAQVMILGNHPAWARVLVLMGAFALVITRSVENQLAKELKEAAEKSEKAARQAERDQERQLRLQRLQSKQQRLAKQSATT